MALLEYSGPTGDSCTGIFTLYWYEKLCRQLFLEVRGIQNHLLFAIAFEIFD